jgi:signal transduction histidine kinase/ActR/RegA family two-component response regulator
MPERIRILACEYQAPEFQSAAATIGCAELEVCTYPSRCGMPPLTWSEVASRVEPGVPTLLFGGCCLGKLEDTPPTGCAGIRVCHEAQCTGFAVDPSLLRPHLEQGAYVLTPGWLGDWRGRLDGWQNNEDQLRAFWKESATRLIYLDTGTLPLDEQARAFASHVDLPLEIIQVGISYLEQQLAREVLGLQADQQRSRLDETLHTARRQAAERTTALEFLSDLSQSLREDEVISRISQMFCLLFGATRVELALSDDLLANDLLSPRERDRRTEAGFRLRIGSQQQEVGILSVDGVALPQHLSEYLNLAISMAGVCALAILNARTYKAVEDSRASQRLMLDVLDVFYRQGPREDDTRAALDIIQTFLHADAFALRLFRNGRLEQSLAQGLPDLCPILSGTGRSGEPVSMSSCLCESLLAHSLSQRSTFLTPWGSLWIPDLQAALPILADLGLPDEPHNYCLPLGFQSILIIPLLSNDQRIGILQLYMRAPHSFDQPKVELLEGVASAITVGLVRRWAEVDLRLANTNLETRVQSRTEELASINRDLRTEIIQRIQAERHLAQKTLELQKRIKEIECLYAISTLLEQEHDSLDELLRQSTLVISEGWGATDQTRTRILLDGTTYGAQPIPVTPWRITREIVIGGRHRGSIEVYREPSALDSPILEEETHLLEAVTELLEAAIERIEMHQEKVLVGQQLIQAQRLEAIGTLAGGIAHDFNNILTPILCSAEIGLMRLADSDPLRKQLMLIHEAGQRAKSLVNQILLFGRRNESAVQAIDLRATVLECMRLIRATLPSTIEIRQTLPEGAVSVLADGTQMHQILMNLCTNAFHAMEHHVGLLQVTLATQEVEADALGSNGGHLPGPHALLRVSDNGHGMPPEVRDRIFEPFFTTKEAGKGTGLGLSVVHGLVQSYGGHITVDSQVGRGTSVSVYLPLVTVGVAEIPATCSSALPQGSERILLVDDEVTICETMAQLLSGLGYRVETETDSVRAVARMAQNPNAFDLVITDFTLPKMTGVELATALHALRPSLPILLCSGLTPPLDSDGMANLGIRDFVQKPFSAQQLSRTIRTALTPPQHAGMRKA